MTRFVRVHLGVTLMVTCVTAWFSYAYFHIDEYFQVVELARFKLGQVEPWALPWEHASRMRPWLQPFAYWAIGRAASTAGVHDPFTLAFLFRLATGLACVAALAAFVRVTLPWLASDVERRAHVRVATLLGFLPYLFVRTSSETAAMAAFTGGFAVLFSGASPDVESAGRAWHVPSLRKHARPFAAGALFGVAFEARFQSLFMTLGVLAWLVVAGRARARHVLVVASGAGLVVALAAPIDRWGYGAWAFPPWTYFQANVLEGAAGFFGADPPLSYAWMLPANVFFPVVLALLAFAALAWVRCPLHPVTWATLPFFVVHNLIPHKEERFLFPMAILATAFFSMAASPSAGRRTAVADFLWRRRRGVVARGLVVASFAGMLLLAFVPLGWHHHVPFARYVNDAMGGELRAYALPDFDLGLPAFHPRVYDVEKLAPEQIEERLEAGRARGLLVTDCPVPRTGLASLDARMTLVWSELPLFESPLLRARLVEVVDAYNARARAPLRPLAYRSVYRLE